MPNIILDRQSEVPLHRQIQDQIATAIRGGPIGNGARLPSTRLLAKLLGVSRNTVFAAYEELAADDLIRGERGSGMRVSHPSAGPEASWVALKRVVAEAGYPARILAIEDMDGNPLYINS